MTVLQKQYPEVDANPDFPKIEERVLDFWKREKIFEASVAGRAGVKDGHTNEFIFYDGPPFANGLPHYGHLLTSFVKDVVARYQTMRGHRVERRFGWDCHGLPAEMGAEKELGIEGRQAITKYGIGKFNDYCRTSVMKYTQEWEYYVSRAARWVDFEHDYKTMDTPYMESVLWAFKQLYDKGWVYEAYRVMPYSWAAETPLSNFETRLDNSYREREDRAITVAFELNEKPKGAPDADTYYILAWTTTPWTLPSNLALAVSEKVEYVGVVKERICYILARSAFDKYAKDLLNLIDRTFDGELHPITTAALLSVTYKPLFPYFKDHPNSFRILDGSEFVTDTDGTGVVHMAPGFGEDDQRLCEASGIELVCPVDHAGRFTDEIYDIDFDGNTVGPLNSPPACGGGDAHHGKIGEGEFTARDPQSLERAREMRKQPTDAEHKLWHYLQREQLENCKFRRQYSVGPYIADFCCIEKSLIVEIDGGQHGDSAQMEYDVARTKFLERAGFRVLRFWNNDVLQNTDGVREAIAKELRKQGTPTLPSPASGGGDDGSSASGGGDDRHETSPSRGEGLSDVLSLKGKNVLEENLAKYKFGEANELIVKWLKEHGHLIGNPGQIKHNYPHCWRTDKPLIYRAVPSWYVEVTKFRDRMVTLNQDINWIPEHVRDGLFGKWLENARDWSISRNRFWGTPIPVWRSKSGKIKVFGSIAELEAASGQKITDLHRPQIDNIIINEGGEEYRRVEDVFDCWFESGSMPYAQVHYPFENKEWFEKHFPADFITEYMAQTRGWFYTLMVLSTALFDKPPFKNCICHGVVIDDETGLKYSKRLKNYKDPKWVFDTFGSDALRWLMLSSAVMRGLDLSVDPDGKFIRDVVRLAIKPIWNAYNFFCLYANADGVKAKLMEKPRDKMDEYILAECRQAVKDIEDALNKYDTPTATEAVLDFSSHLNNWYIRRNKERFWKPVHDADKQDAYDTLYTSLLYICRAAAPLLPLILEDIYKGLTGEKSVHLTDWPDVSHIVNTDKLLEPMWWTLDTCNAALAVRNRANIRVRQPLANLIFVGRRHGSESEDYYEQLIKDEVNIKNVNYDSDISRYANFKLQINFPVLGKRLPEKIKQIIPAAKKGSWKKLKDGRLEVAGETLEPGEFTLLLEPKQEFKDRAQPLSTNDALVILDTEVTNELAAEGFARDMVRLIQQARKDAGLHVSDRIHLRLRVSENLAAALQEHHDFIAEQVLAASLDVGDMQGCTYIVNETIENEEVSIGFTVKAAA